MKSAKNRKNPKVRGRRCTCDTESQTKNKRQRCNRFFFFILAPHRNESFVLPAEPRLSCNFRKDSSRASFLVVWIVSAKVHWSEPPPGGGKCQLPVNWIKQPRISCSPKPGQLFLWRQSTTKNHKRRIIRPSIRIPPVSHLQSKKNSKEPRNSTENLHKFA